MKKINLLVLCLFIGVTTIFAQVVDFEELMLDAESHWNGSDESGSFTSGYLTFDNDYDSEYGSWQGFAYTNETDNTTYDWMNAFTSASGIGVESSANYAVSYIGSDWANDYSPIPSWLKIAEDIAPEVIPGMYVSLNANSSLYMADADYYENGKHWLKLQVTAHIHTTRSVVTKDIILADYRFVEDGNFKLNEWTYIDLSWAADADSLSFIMLSSDAGDYGINTPTYFCMDNFGADIPVEMPELVVEVLPEYNIAEGESINLLALAHGGVQPYSFEWCQVSTLENIYSQTPIVTPTETSVYTVTIEDAIGTVIHENVLVNVGTTGVEQNIEENVDIYVNQSGNLYVSNSGIIDNLLIYDVTGKVVLEKAINDYSANLDLISLSKGMYIVAVFSENQRITRKIIK